MGGFTKNGAGLPAPEAQCQRQPSCWVSCCSGRLPCLLLISIAPAARAASGDVNGAVKDYLSQADSIASSKSRGEALCGSGADACGQSFPDGREHAGATDRELPEHPDRRWPRADRDDRAAPSIYDAIRAGMRLVAAASIDPGHVDAGRWMLDAGSAFADAGDFGQRSARFEWRRRDPLRLSRLIWRRDAFTSSATRRRRYSFLTTMPPSERARRVRPGRLARPWYEPRHAWSTSTVERPPWLELDEVAEDGEVDAVARASPGSLSDARRAPQTVILGRDSARMHAEGRGPRVAQMTGEDCTSGSSRRGHLRATGHHR